jgi:hypothetical protein
MCVCACVCVCVSVEERKLFIGMLPKTYTDADVRRLFQSFGTVDDCTILRDLEGHSKGRCFTLWVFIMVVRAYTCLLKQNVIKVVVYPKLTSCLQVVLFSHSALNRAPRELYC